MIGDLFDNPSFMKLCVKTLTGDCFAVVASPSDLAGGRALEGYKLWRKDASYKWEIPRDPQTFYVQPQAIVWATEWKS